MSDEINFRAFNPICVMEMSELPRGVYSLAVLMSSAHYGLILGVDPVELECMDTPEIKDEIVIPLLQIFPSLVESYRNILKKEVSSFTVLDMNCRFCLYAIQAQQIEFMSRQHTRKGMYSDEPMQYFFIAQEDVTLDEFMFSSRLLN